MPSVASDLPWWASLVAQMIKNLPAMQETWVQFLGWEDPLEKRSATHSSIYLVWRIPWTEKLGRLQSRGLKRVGHNSATKQSDFHLTPLPTHGDPSDLTNRVTFAKHLASVSVQITLVLFYSKSRFLSFDLYSTNSVTLVYR